MTINRISGDNSRILREYESKSEDSFTRTPTTDTCNNCSESRHLGGLTNDGYQSGSTQGEGETVALRVIADPNAASSIQPGMNASQLPGGTIGTGGLVETEDGGDPLVVTNRHVVDGEEDQPGRSQITNTTTSDSATPSSGEGVTVVAIGENNEVLGATGAEAKFSESGPDLAALKMDNPEAITRTGAEAREVSADSPEAGEKLQAQGPQDDRGRQQGPEEREVVATGQRDDQGNLLYDTSREGELDKGSSGSSVANEEDELVAVNAFKVEGNGRGVSGGADVTAGPGREELENLFGQFGEELAIA